MGVWTSFKSSYQARGVHTGDLPFHEHGPSAAFKAAYPGVRAPREGLLHSMKRGISDSMIDSGNPGWITGSNGSRIAHGGSLLSPSGWRDVTHKVEAAGNGMYRIGARRSFGGMLGKGLMKGAGSAMFLYQAATEGLLPAVKDQVEFGAMFGAAKWGLGRLGMGLASPALWGAAAIVGGGIAVRETLIAGRKYNQDVRKASFGNAFNDMYGSAATMRQASLMAIQGSKINGRSALGSEANLMHMR